MQAKLFELVTHISRKTLTAKFQLILSLSLSNGWTVLECLKFANLITQIMTKVLDLWSPLRMLVKIPPTPTQQGCEY